MPELEVGAGTGYEGTRGGLSAGLASGGADPCIDGGLEKAGGGLELKLPTEGPLENCGGGLEE